MALAVSAAQSVTTNVVRLPLLPSHLDMPTYFSYMSAPDAVRSQKYWNDFKAYRALQEEAQKIEAYLLHCYHVQQRKRTAFLATEAKRRAQRNQILEQLNFDVRILDDPAMARREEFMQFDSGADVVGLLKAECDQARVQISLARLTVSMLSEEYSRCAIRFLERGGSPAPPPLETWDFHPCTKLAPDDMAPAQSRHSSRLQKELLLDNPGASIPTADAASHGLHHSQRKGKGKGMEGTRLSKVGVLDWDSVL